MSRAQLKRMYLDVNFFSNPKIEALGYKFGSASQACLLEILCAMSKATNAQVDEDFIYSRICKHQIKEPSDYFNYLIDKNIIFKDGVGFSNDPVIKDQESYARKLEASNARVTRFREKKEALSCERVTRTPDTDSDYDNVTDINIKELDTPEIRKWIPKARALIRKSGGNPDLIWLEAQLLKYAGRPEDFLAALKHTATLTRSRNLYDPSTPRASPKLSAAERNLEATKEALRQIKEEIEL